MSQPPWYLLSLCLPLDVPDRVGGIQRMTEIPRPPPTVDAYTYALGVLRGKFNHLLLADLTALSELFSAPRRIFLNAS